MCNVRRSVGACKTWGQICKPTPIFPTWKPIPIYIDLAGYPIAGWGGGGQVAPLAPPPRGDATAVPALKYNYKKGNYANMKINLRTIDWSSLKHMENEDCWAFYQERGGRKCNTICSQIQEEELEASSTMVVQGID